MSMDYHWVSVFQWLEEKSICMHIPHSPNKIRWVKRFFKNVYILKAGGDYIADVGQLEKAYQDYLMYQKEILYERQMRAFHARQNIKQKPRKKA